MASTFELRRSKYLEEYSAQLAHSRPSTARLATPTQHNAETNLVAASKLLVRPSTSCGVLAKGWDSDS
eukprot:CAMPEP_0196588728 /NCGR_PEP_ID=MMETSP1081-20130531/61534_1 /TAXON_ID=36882 /ORGANISM="Pyramimonas amylifera, Strain CCMP720" /LENGTH=67 /DNA_ID=CAMNT_0041911321 /DNA_START=1 /DNA_END=200 /DNA_ORIENTATION=+